MANNKNNNLFSKDLKSEYLENVVDILKSALDSIGSEKAHDEKFIKENIETPPSAEMGDFAFPCFPLSKELKKNPKDIALSIRKEMGNPPKGFSQILTSGAYINFYLNREEIVWKIAERVKKERNNFGNNSLGKDRNVMVEFPSPNTNKPLHIGHLRNIALGESISRIKEFSQEKVIRANMNNDRGSHICKSMLAYKKFGFGKTPSKENKKPDHFVGDFYVLFDEKASQSKKKEKEFEKEAQEMLKKWEEGDKETVELWKKMNDWALKGFEQTYKRLGIFHDKEYFENKIYKKAKKIIEEGLEKEIFIRKESGEVIADLSEEGLGEKVVLRKDGTAIYITQDLYLAKVKFEDFRLDESVCLTASEQDYHFKVLFSLVDKLGVASRKKMNHIGYGMVRLPQGKIKSREGTSGISADEIIDNVQELVKKELSSRVKLGKKELEERSLKIVLASINYFLLKVGIKKDMVFNPEESVNFEGDTGAYLEYTHARANSILKKHNELSKSRKNSKKESSSGKSFYAEEGLDEKEKELISKFLSFHETVKRAYTNTDPSEIATYVSELAKCFNEFYHSCHVINSEREQFRLELVKITKQIIGNCLWLLGVDALEEM